MTAFFFSGGLHRLPYVLCKLQYVKIYLMPPLIGVLGIKFYCRPSVRMYLPPIIFRQLKLYNCSWEWFEIWYIASALWVVSCVWLTWMPHVDSLFTGLQLNTLYTSTFVKFSSAKTVRCCNCSTKFLITWQLLLKWVLFVIH